MFKQILPTLLGVALSLPAAAANWGFLQDKPAGHFTDQDWALLGETQQKALDTLPDGETLGWNNTASGAYGTIQPLSTADQGGTTCRDTEIFNSAKGTSATSRFLFCKQPDGSWKVAPRTPATSGKP